MRHTELATRYARALFEFVAQDHQQDATLVELRLVLEALQKDKVVFNTMMSPTLKAEDREKILKASLEKTGISSSTQGFLLLLAGKGRLPIFPQIVEAFKDQNDKAHGIKRGTVRSATILMPDERARIEEIVSRFTDQQVILTYREDASVIGGLIAEVGSYTFDDTLTSHLKRLKEETMRRVE